MSTSQTTPTENSATTKTRKILVIDDNAMMRRLIERSLRTAGYDLELVDGGPKALQQMMAGAVYDLVITDIVMPQLSGLELANWIRRNPQLKNMPILFCSCIAEDETIQAVRQIERASFVMKPIRREHLLEHVERLLSGQPAAASATPKPGAPKPKSGGSAVAKKASPPTRPPSSVRRKASDGSTTTDEARPKASATSRHAKKKAPRIGGDPRFEKVVLPTLSLTSQKVLELSNDPEATAHAYARVVSSDPGLTSAVLKLVNSALYSFRKQITTVPEACVLIGLRNLSSLCLSAAFAQEKFDGPEELVKSCWRYSLATGNFSMRFAQICRSDEAPNCGVAGLLHSVGMIALLCSPDLDYPGLLEEADARMLDISELEQERYGFHHGHLAQKVLEAWKIGPRVQQIVSRGPDLGPNDDLEAWIVGMASLGVQRCDPSFVHRANPEESWQNVGQHHGEYVPKLESQLEKVWQDTTLQLKLLER